MDDGRPRVGLEVDDTELEEVFEVMRSGVQRG